MARIFVGNSEYGSLRGTPQYSEERAGLQLLATLAEVRAEGHVVTVNEASRPRASQTAFWNDYVRRGSPPAAVAARPFTSKHDGGPNDESSAFDLGGPGGSVISDAAHASVKRNGAKYGIQHTGAGFRPAEKWHFQYVHGTASVLASNGPTQKEQEEEQMTARLYRHSGNGNIAGIDPTTGWFFHCPNPDYVALLRALRIVVDADPISLAPNHYEFIQGRVTAHRQDIAAQVWAQAIPGYNGLASAQARLAGIDEKAGIAKVDTSGLTVKVDEASLAAKVVGGVKELFGKAAS